MSLRKIALITGASRGLGKDMAHKIAAKGMDVVITYNNNEEMALQTVNEIIATGARSFALQLNMSDFTNGYPTHFNRRTNF